MIQTSPAYNYDPDCPPGIAAVLGLRSPRHVMTPADFARQRQLRHVLRNYTQGSRRQRKAELQYMLNLKPIIALDWQSDESFNDSNERVRGLELHRTMRQLQSHGKKRRKGFGRSPRLTPC